ncbi:MAG: transposase [Planctomycetes bacterium]|nr:transposase [Planctomycetota bacterium]
MPRMARLRVESGEAWYHIYCRVSGKNDEYPLDVEGAREALIRHIRFYARAYECEVAGFCVMGNHYHLVVRFSERVELGRKELMKRAKLLYPNTWEAVKGWGDERFQRLNNRLFDVSEFVRNIQQGYTKWYNRAVGRSGRLWAERFRSTILEDSAAVRDCLLYVDLNPVRAGMVERPEDYEHGSAKLRDMALDKWLLDLREILGVKSKTESRALYRSLLYNRGAVQTREGQAAIPESAMTEAEAADFQDRGIFRKRLRHFTRGLVLGSRESIAVWLERCRESGYYRRRTRPQNREGVFSLG